MRADELALGWLSTDISGSQDRRVTVRQVRSVVRVRAERVMERKTEAELRDELVRLKTEHRELDDEIIALEASPTADQLQIRRLKKQKLVLKDRIQSIEDQLLPDIIA